MASSRVDSAECYAGPDRAAYTADVIPEEGRRMGELPALEVVVAAYGPSPFLRLTIESAMAYLPGTVSVTILDDCSPDDSVRRVAKEFAGRINYRRNDRNLGTSGSFNEAMRISRSRYTVLLGPDDLILPGAQDAYARAVRLETGAGAIHPGVRVIDETGALVKPLPDKIKHLLRPGAGLHKGQETAVRILLGNWTYNPAIAWRTDLVDSLPFDESLKTAMDLDRLLRLAMAGETLLLTDAPALAYRRHSGAVSSVNRGAQRLSEELGIHARAMQQFRERGWHAALAAAQLAPTARAHGLQVAATSLPSPARERLATTRIALSVARPLVR